MNIYLVHNSMDSVRYQFISEYLCVYKIDSVLWCLVIEIIVFVIKLYVGSIRD